MRVIVLVIDFLGLKDCNYCENPKIILKSFLITITRTSTKVLNFGAYRNSSMSKNSSVSLIDTHAHLDRLDSPAEAVQEAITLGVRQIVAVSMGLTSAGCLGESDSEGVESQVSWEAFSSLVSSSAIRISMESRWSSRRSILRRMSLADSSESPFPADDPFLSGTNITSEESFSRVVRRSEELVNLIEFALSDEYIDVRWRAERSGR